MDKRFRFPHLNKIFILRIVEMKSIVFVFALHRVRNSPSAVIYVLVHTSFILSVVVVKCRYCAYLLRKYYVCINVHLFAGCICYFSIVLLLKCWRYVCSKILCHVPDVAHCLWLLSPIVGNCAGIVC